MADLRFIDLPDLVVISDDQTLLAASLPPHSPGNSRSLKIETLSNYILNLVPTLPDYPKYYSEGFYLNYSTASVVEIKPGAMRSDDNTFNLNSSASLFPNLAVSGVNGLDSGLEAASTWYAVHVIADSNNVNPIAGLFSLSSTTPILPAGYDKFGFRGWVRNNSSSNIWQFIDQSSGRKVKHRYFNVGRDQTQVLANGLATTFTTVSAASFVPPGCTSAEIFVGFDNQTTANHAYAFRVNSETAIVDTQHISYTQFAGSAAVIYTRENINLNSSREFQYRVYDNGSGTPSAVQVSVRGFEYSI